MDKLRRQIIELVKRANSILLMPSSPVDGDSLGAALALYITLKKLGKEATVVCADPVPDAFQFLPTTHVISNDFTAAQDFIVTLDCKKSKLKSIRSALEHDKVNIILTASKGKFSSHDVSFSHGPSRYDLIITVDTADLSQLGRFYEDNVELFSSIPVINIDHHASNLYFGKINLVDIMSSATTELLIPLIEELEADSGQKIMDDDIATLLLAGIITDTGSFQNANTTPKSFAASAYLIRNGARQQEIIQHVFKTKNLSTLRLWGRILSNIKTDEKYKMIWSTLSRRDFADAGARDDETGGIIDELMTNAPGTEVILLLKERDDGIISGSLRTTNPSIDASSIAEIFGGGGHTQAAGFKVSSADLYDTEKQVVEAIRAYQHKRLHLEEQASQPVPIKEVMSSNNTSSDGIKQLIDAWSTTGAAPVDQEKNAASSAETKAAGPSRKSITPEKVKKTAPKTEETFTEMIIKKARTKNHQNEIEPGITYRFEE